MDKPIYIVVTPFFPSSTNWRGSYCYDFVKALQHEGSFDVRVFMPGGGDAYEYNGVRVRTFRARQLPSAIFPFLFARWNAASFLRALALEHISVSNVAVCHGHTATFSVYPRAVKKANPNCITLLHHHDPQSFGLNSGVLCHCWFYNLIEFPILRWYHEQIDLHVFISEMVKRSFISAPDADWTQYSHYRRQMRCLPYRHVRVRHSVVLHNGVDLNIFKPLKSGMAKRDRFTIGTIGNFVDWKDQISLLRAAAILKEIGRDVKLIAIGSGPELEGCKKYAVEKNLDVDFQGEVPHEKLVDFYQSIDLFVLPSYFEGFGCVFTEAYASGVPFITCKGQGMDDLINEGEEWKWLCNQRDPVDLAGKIDMFMKNQWKQKLSATIDSYTLAERFVGVLRNWIAI